MRPFLQEDPKQTLYFAHLFFADHILSSAWLIFFAVLWWVYTPHDGTVQIHSDAQKAVQESGPGHNMTAQERAAAAMTIWNAEKGIATAMIVMGWILKVCIIVCFSVLPYPYLRRNVVSDLFRRPAILVRHPPPQGLLPLAPPLPIIFTKRHRQRWPIFNLRPPRRGRR